MCKISRCCDSVNKNIPHRTNGVKSGWSIWSRCLSRYTIQYSVINRRGSTCQPNCICSFFFFFFFFKFISFICLFTSYFKKCIWSLECEWRCGGSRDFDLIALSDENSKNVSFCAIQDSRIFLMPIPRTYSVSQWVKVETRDFETDKRPTYPTRRTDGVHCFKQINTTDDSK